MARGFGKGGNSSGRGPVGKAPASRAPIKAAVTPKGLGTLNPNAKGGPVRTGGGQGSNKHVRVTPAVGSSQTRKTSPDTVSNIGRSVGNKAMDTGGKVLQRNDPPLHKPAQAPSRLGNDLALNVGRGGPGAGRFNHGPSGSQGTYGASSNRQGQINRDGSIVAPGPRNSGGR
jgi:hypothetical protein